MTTVGIEQAQSNLVELVESVTRGDHVELVPVNLVSGKSKIKPGFGGAKGLI